MRIPRPRSVRVRLTLWYVSAMVIVLAAYSGTLYVFLSHSFYETVDRKLRQDFESVSDSLSGGGVPDALKDIAAQQAQQDRWLVEIFDAKRTLAASLPSETDSPLGALPDVCTDTKGAFDQDSVDGLHLRVWCGPAKRGGDPYYVRVARPIERVREELRRFLELMLTGLPFAVALAGLGGAFLSRRVLRPVADMTRAAERISAEKLDERLPVENPDDELGRLATAFNGAFARIQRTFDEMKRFTADASHELRTPLTVIRTVGEVALRDGGNGANHREIISNVLEETDRLRHLVDSLLTLSRADAGQVTLKRERVDLGALAEDVVSHLSVLAEEKGQALRCRADGKVEADADRSVLRQALINIVHNAVKYCPAGAAIELRVAREGGRIVLEVSDNGPGIAREHHARLFDRFYRVDTGRSREEGGSGLGLSIARWAAEAHGGAIELESEPGKGSRFRIFLKDGDAKA